MATYEKTGGTGVTVAPTAPTPGQPTAAHTMPAYQQPNPQFAMRPGPIQPVAQHFTAPTGPPQPWQHGLFDCFSDMSTCLLGMVLPCAIYSKTHQRIRTSPSSVKNFSYINAACVGWACSGGVSSVRQRNEIRYRYNLQGDGLGDWCRHTCCSRCALIQEELEVRDRERQMVQMYNAYVTQQPMSYAPQS